MKIAVKIAKLFQKTRIAFYRHILSNTKVQGKFKIASPTLFCTLGNGSIQIEKGVILGITLSPCFYSGSNNIDVRRGGNYYSKRNCLE